MKTLKLKTILLVVLMFTGTSGFSQTNYTKKSAYPNWSVSPVGGIVFPTGNMSENFKSGGNVGVDISYRVNKEVGFYGQGGYYFLGSKTAGVPDGKYLEYTAGPRYYFTAPNLKSSVYLEAGIGAYTFVQDAYVQNEVEIAEVNETRFGYNAGLGAVLNLGTNVDMLFKVKYNTIQTTGGSSSFIAPVIGMDVRF
ncbi:MAG TPA: outer membrane beta-barrel protein [Ignavibacteria bacterium]|nr:outer membrane beta-barrel protein [Ignavibacteria bacterium]